MKRVLGSLAVVLSLCLAPVAVDAQQTKPAPKVGKGEKLCKTKLKYSGEVRTWTCKKEEPCCVWHEINYVKCGSTITGCL